MTKSLSVDNFPSTANLLSPSLYSNSFTIGAKRKKLRKVDYLVDTMKSLLFKSLFVYVVFQLLIISLNFARVFEA